MLRDFLSYLFFLVRSIYNPKMRRSRERAPAAVKKRERAEVKMIKSNSQPGDMFWLMKGWFHLVILRKIALTMTHAMPSAASWVRSPNMTAAAAKGSATERNRMRESIDGDICGEDCIFHMTCFLLPWTKNMTASPKRSMRSPKSPYAWIEDNRFID